MQAKSPIQITTRGNSYFSLGKRSCSSLKTQDTICSEFSNKADKFPNKDFSDPSQSKANSAMSKKNFKKTKTKNLIDSSVNILDISTNPSDYKNTVGLRSINGKLNAILSDNLTQFECIFKKLKTVAGELFSTSDDSTDYLGSNKELGNKFNDSNKSQLEDVTQISQKEINMGDLLRQQMIKDYIYKNDNSSYINTIGSKHFGINQN